MTRRLARTAIAAAGAVHREKREAEREPRKCKTRECARREVREVYDDRYYRRDNRSYRDGRYWDRNEYEHRYYRARPHQALAMRYPAELYVRSARPCRGLEELDYPFHDHSHLVTHCGRIGLDNRKISLSTVFAGQKVGVKQVAERVWPVSFMHYDRGFFDNESCRVEAAENPFGAKVLTMPPE